LQTRLTMNPMSAPIPQLLYPRLSLHQFLTCEFLLILETVVFGGGFFSLLFFFLLFGWNSSVSTTVGQISQVQYLYFVHVFLSLHHHGLTDSMHSKRTQLCLAITWDTTLLQPRCHHTSYTHLLHNSRHLKFHSMFLSHSKPTFDRQKCIITKIPERQKECAKIPETMGIKLRGFTLEWLV
jgi:hypothetical protein